MKQAGRRARPVRRRPCWQPGTAVGLLAVAVVTAIAVPAPAALAAPAAAFAAAPAGPGTLGMGNFGISPSPDSQGRVAPYFSLTVPAGHTVRATVAVSNLSGRAEKLKLGRAAGVTAANGGSAYAPAARGCSGAGCWVSGLPGVITLPPHTRELLSFTVHVPPGTRDGQYLGGISAGPPAKPRSVKIGSNGKATARAIIVEDVTVGVAVTVGRLAAMTTRFRIPGVLGAIEGPVARLNIRLNNTGQTFTHGTGRAICTAGGKQHRYKVSANTVLPHQHALIAVNAPGLPEGRTLPCRVWIHYGRHQTVSWAGLVAIPAPSGSRIIHTGHGAYAIVPQGGMPVWAIVLIAMGGLILAGLGVLLYRLR